MKHFWIVPADRVASILLISIGFLSLAGQFARVQTSFGRMSWFEPLIVIFSLYITWRYPSGKIIQLQHLPSWLMSFAALLVWMFVLTSFRAATVSVSLLLSLIPAMLRIMSMVWFGYSLFWVQQRQKTKLAQASLIWLHTHAVLGIGQYLLLPDARQFLFLGWDEHLNRAFGTLFDPTYFGVLMVLGAVVSLEKGSQAASRWRAPLWSLSFALFLLATTISFSRAVYLAYIAGVLTLAAARKQRKLLLAIPALVMALFLVPKDGGGVGQNLARTQTIVMRQEVIEKHAHQIPWSDRVLGQGWGYEKLQAETTQKLDSLPLQLLFAGGAPAIFLSITTLVLAWKSTTRPLIRATLATITFHSLIAPSWLYSWIQMGVIAVLLLSDPSTDQVSLTTE